MSLGFLLPILNGPWLMDWDSLSLKALKNKMLQSIKKTRNAKDDRTRYRPRHDIDTRIILYGLKGLKRLN